MLITTRLMNAQDYTLLPKFCYLSLFIPDGEQLLSMEDKFSASEVSAVVSPVIKSRITEVH